MNKKEKPRGRQREFLFVFSNGCDESGTGDAADKSDVAHLEFALDEERTKLLRRRLISELRDLGC